MASERTVNFSTSELLARLNTRDTSRAWKQFLRQYSPLIMHIAGQYEHDRDARNDCYLFICEKLSDRDFHRLLAFQPEGPASFRSWLNVVIANLCIDWRRHVNGRPRPFKSIKQLSLLDQMVFKYKFQQGAGLTTCFALVQASFPGLTETELDGAVVRINQALTRKQHWLLSIQRAQTVSLDQPATGVEMELVETSPDPEETTGLAGEQKRLRQAMAMLSPRQRLLLKLRYEQDLSLKEIARLTRLGDPFRARRHIKAALDELARHFKT